MMFDKGKGDVTVEKKVLPIEMSGSHIAEAPPFRETKVLYGLTIAK
jgi:hypothetical protein